MAARSRLDAKAVKETDKGIGSVCPGTEVFWAGPSDVSAMETHAHSTLPLRTIQVYLAAAGAQEIDSPIYHTATNTTSDK